MVKAGTLANLAVIAGLGVVVLGFVKEGGVKSLGGVGKAGAGFLDAISQGFQDIREGVVAITPEEQQAEIERREEEGLGGFGIPGFPTLPGTPIKRAEGVEQDEEFVSIPPPRLTPARAARAAAERTGQLSVVVPAGATGQMAREFVEEIRERGGSIGQITFTGLGSPEQLGRLGIEQGEEAGAF